MADGMYLLSSYAIHFVILKLSMQILEDYDIYTCLSGGFATHPYLNQMLYPYPQKAADAFHDKYPYRNLESFEYSMCRESDIEYFTTTDMEKALKYTSHVMEVSLK